MMEQIIDYRKGYQEYKQELDTELRKTTEGFVRIGYLLKVAKDTDVLKESGYANVYDFAQAEYNIDKSQVSRFININDRFSEGGYSDRLKDHFQGFGHAKLTIMLQLPDEINAELTPDFTKSEIQAIKEEYDAENAVTDIEVLLEGEDTEQKTIDNNLYKVLHQLCREDTDLYGKLFFAVNDPAAVQETLAPDGEKIYSIRIMGVGRMMLSVKSLDRPVTLTNMRSSEKEEFSWEETLRFLNELMHPGTAVAESWELTYGEKFPEKQEVAPVQPSTTKEPAKKELPKKETKVKKAAKPVPKKEEQPAAQEEQLPGQDNIMNHPEYLPPEPDAGSSPNVDNPIENITASAEIVDKTPLEEAESPKILNAEPILEENETDIAENETESEENETVNGCNKTIAGWRAGISSAIRMMDQYLQEGSWDKLVTEAQKVQWRAEKIMEMESKDVPEHIAE